MQASCQRALPLLVRGDAALGRIEMDKKNIFRFYAVHAKS